ncbi:MAG TPA: ABC transporter permease, partial [Candidatus Saccharimonadales bacterium]|nr:ABC transporter permease [Candidatus Saccharimonadales bacterium]
PMMLSSFNIPRNRWAEADWVNQIVINYSSDMIVNRALVVILVALILMVLYFRFTTTEEDNSSGESLTLNLATPADTVHILPAATVEHRFQEVEVVRPKISIPAVALVNTGARANLRKLVAAISVELTLLRHEKSLIVLVPLAIVIAFLSLPFSIGASGVSTSAMFAGSSVRGLSLFLLGTIVFYVGEAMHRDQEVRIGSTLWATPTHNNVLLLSKFFAVLLVSVLLMILAGVTAMLTQFVRGQTPIDVLS